VAADRALSDMDAQPIVEVHEDLAALTRAARARFVQSAQAAIAARGRCDIALAGGSTPRALYAALERADLDWSALHCWFGDERCVPPEDAQSNYRMAREALFDRLALAPENVHRMEGELDPSRAASRYEDELARHFGAPLPRFDLCWLGLGADGHTASLFPGTSALDERRRACVACWVPRLDAWRLTLTFPALARSREIVFLVCGAEKAEALRRTLARDAELPAARVAPEDGVLRWMVDRAAS
jgi:6-phosphogluconolactonase